MNIYTMKFNAKTGLIPYIELNGEQYSDSNMIMQLLRDKFPGRDSDTDLTTEQRALGHLATSMVEHFTAQTGFHYR